MDRIPLLVKDQNTLEALNHIMNNGMGKPLVVDTAPTSTSLKVGEPQYYNGDMYIKFPNGECKKFQGATI